MEEEILELARSFRDVEPRETPNFKCVMFFRDQLIALGVPKKLADRYAVRANFSAQEFNEAVQEVIIGLAVGFNKTLNLLHEEFPYATEEDFLHLASSVSFTWE